MKKNVLECIRQWIYTIMPLTVVMFISSEAHAQFTLSGTIIEKNSGQSLPGAHVSVDPDELHTVSDGEGRFTFRSVKAGIHEIRVSFMGFRTFKQKLILDRDSALMISLEGHAILGDEVNIIATRAQSKYPTAYSSVTREQISAMNLGKDIPYLIQKSPSVLVTSDAGNGIGYTGISIRGTDLTRINVTVNGIPLNDAESQGVWFVDLPDLASSAADIQIQRGVGTSVNGAGAFGASINFMTSDLQQDPYGSADISGGSFGTFKSTLRFGTGLMKSRWSLDGRLSYIRSDGYIDRASSTLKSYYLSGGYYGSKTTFRMITFSGLEDTYQAWNGVPKDSLATNRTYNPSGEYFDQNGNIHYYNNQIDHYQQDNYQMILSRAITAKWNLNLALHYTRGRGYYENYKQGESFTDYGLNNVIIGNDTITQTDLINRKMMDNEFAGFTFSSNYAVPDRLKLTLGGAWNRYSGDHFGKVIWAQYASNGTNDRNWYENTGLKYDFNIYTKIGYQAIHWLNFFADLQYRQVNYKLEGLLDDGRTISQDNQFDFFNPKAGIFITPAKNHEFYFSLGVANREPSRNDYKDADPGKTPTNETLFDWELGYNLNMPNFSLGANAYFMKYRNQLVLTGEINNVGEAVRANVPHSYRAGLELTSSIRLFKELLTWNVTTTFSDNRIIGFIQYVDMYDEDWNYMGQQITPLGNTCISFSPSILVGSEITVKPLKNFSMSLNSKYVGKQYIDNSSSRIRSLDAFFVNGFAMQYHWNTSFFKEIAVNFALNNLLNARYETNAWVYPCLINGNYAEYNGYFPQATINFLLGVSLKL